MIHSENRIKYVISTVAVVVIVNITICDEKTGNIWDFAWSQLGYVFGKAQLHCDAGLNIYQFLDKYNYTLESHEVITEDGYILTLHRIPHERNYETTKSNVEIQRNATRPPILLAHCLAGSAMEWIWQGPNTSLALLLADMGYDVWLVNSRGNAHSSRHQKLTPDTASFWDFSFHEKGYYDIASIIDYILNKTGLDKITYIGHSEGTSEGVALTTSRPEYNDKMNLMVLLSPVIYMTHSCSPVAELIMKYEDEIKIILELLHIQGVPFSETLSLVTQNLCSSSSPFQKFCIQVMDGFAGFDPDQIDLERLPVYLTNTPSGFSFKDITHYKQETKSGAFRRYDFGSSLLNILHYGSAEPPSYDIKKITVPVAVYYAKNDYLSNVTDVERLLSELNTEIVDQYLIEYDQFNHLDFVNAKDVKTLLYDRLIKVVQQYNPLSTN